MKKPRIHRYYTCPNSGLIVEIHKIRYFNADYIKVWIKYYINPSLRLLTEERNVKLFYKNIQHWTEVKLENSVFP